MRIKYFILKYFECIKYFILRIFCFCGHPVGANFRGSTTRFQKGFFFVRGGAVSQRFFSCDFSSTFAKILCKNW